MSPQAQIATMVDWALAPRWLSIETACFLSGHDRSAVLDIIDADGVDLTEKGQIEKESLWQFLEAEVLTLHWWG